MIMHYASIVQPHQGKTKTAKDRKGTFIEREGEVAGEVRIVKGWQAIGRAVYLQSYTCNHLLTLYFRALNT